jgi:hypothetical protein
LPRLRAALPLQIIGIAEGAVNVGPYRDLLESYSLTGEKLADPFISFIRNLSVVLANPRIKIEFLFAKRRSIECLIRLLTRASSIDGSRLYDRLSDKAGRFLERSVHCQEKRIMSESSGFSDFP